MPEQHRKGYQLKIATRVIDCDLLIHKDNSVTGEIVLSTGDKLKTDRYLTNMARGMELLVYTAQEAKEDFYPLLIICGGREAKARHIH